MIDHLRAGIFRLAWSAVRAAHRHGIAKDESLPPGVVDAAAEIQTIMAATGISQRESAELYYGYSAIGVSAEQIVEYFLMRPEKVA